MPNYNGVWSLTTQFQYAADWNADNPNFIPPRGIFFAGTDAAGSAVDVIDFITITTTGNATDFGDMDKARENLRGAFGSSTRGVVGGGAVSPADLIQFVTIATTGNASDFGDMLTGTTQGSGASSETRGLFFGGNNGGANSDVIEYVTIASTGNSTDFGDLTQARRVTGSAGSTTRIVTGGGQSVNNPFPRYNTIDYVTIASTGNATDFGDLTLARQGPAAVSSSTRAAWGGGYDGSNYNNVIDYVTIASTGNATDFGDLTEARYDLAGVSNKIRGVFGGGTASGGRSNIIEYITIENTGNGTDFGDLTQSRSQYAACSSVHGGIA